MANKALNFVKTRFSGLKTIWLFFYLLITDLNANKHEVLIFSRFETPDWHRPATSFTMHTILSRFNNVLWIWNNLPSFLGNVAVYERVKQKNSSHRKHSKDLNNDKHVNRQETLNGAKLTQNFHRFCGWYGQNVLSLRVCSHCRITVSKGSQCYGQCVQCTERFRVETESRMYQHVAFVKTLIF